jgi:hypothetical protein
MAAPPSADVGETDDRRLSSCYSVALKLATSSATDVLALDNARTASLTGSRLLTGSPSKINVARVLRRAELTKAVETVCGFREHALYAVFRDPAAPAMVQISYWSPNMRRDSCFSKHGMWKANQHGAFGVV